MWPYSWTHVGTPSHLGHMDRVAATMPSQAHAGAAQEAPNIGQWEGQDVPLVRPSSCTVKGGIPSSRRYLPTYLWWCVYGVLGLLAPVHRCARSVCGGACAVSWAFWLVFTGVHALCVVLCVRCPGPPGSCSPVCTLCAWCYVCLLALLRWCARVVRVVLCVWCPGTLGSCSPVSRCVAVCVVSGVRCCVCGVLGLPAPVHRCACSVCCVVCAVWVWVRARVCHTAAATLQTLSFC